jgi:hypothetical protein
MDQPQANAAISGHEHWTKKGDIKLFLWEKFAGAAGAGPAVLVGDGFLRRAWL